MIETEPTPRGAHAARSAGRLVRLAATVALSALAARAHAATSYVVIAVESIADRRIIDAVSCPLSLGVYVAGGGEGCPIGRAPATGECGLSYDCGGTPPPVPAAVATPDHCWAHLVTQPMVFDMQVPTSAVFVRNAADHAPFPEESIEWTVWGSDSPDTSAFPTRWSLGSLSAIFELGWIETGACPGDDGGFFRNVLNMRRK